MLRLVPLGQIAPSSIPVAPPPTGNASPAGNVPPAGAAAPPAGSPGASPVVAPVSGPAGARIPEGDGAVGA